jgi:multidrug resistance efflux pump
MCAPRLGRVQAVHFREGALVKAGDLLFTVDPAPYAAEVDRAEAQVVAAQARLAYTRSERSAPRACGTSARSPSATTSA